MPTSVSPIFLNAVKTDNINDLEAGSIAVVGSSYVNTTGMRRGILNGPDTIRKMSQNFVESLNYLETGLVRDNSRNLCLDIKFSNMYDLGNLATEQDTFYKEIYDIAAKIYEKECFLLLLGGEHTVTIPAFEAFASVYHGQKIGYIHIDSHMDFGMRNIAYGNIYRGSVSRRVSEFLDGAYSQMIWCGQSDFTSEKQYQYLKNSGAGIFTISDIRRQGVLKVAKKIKYAMRKCDICYVTLDVDVIDSSYAAGVTGPPVVGMTPLELIELLTAIGKLNVKALDVVEHTPDRDITETSSYVIAQILYKTIFCFK